MNIEKLFTEEDKQKYQINLDKGLLFTKLINYLYEGLKIGGKRETIISILKVFK